MIRIRPALLKLHRWVGLALCALLLVQSLSGAVLIFRDPLEKVLHPALVLTRSDDRVSVQAMIDAVRSAHPDWAMRRMDFPDAAGGAVKAELEGTDGVLLVAIDPADARIVREGGMTDWPLRWLFDLHNALLSGKTGELFVGISGLSLLFLAATGPIVWWPGIRRWRSGFRLWHGKGGERLTRSLHRAGGAIVALALVFSAVTGVGMAFKSELRSILQLAGPVIDKPSPKVAEQADLPLLPADRLVALARQKFGGDRLQQIRFPGGTGRVVTVYLDAPSSLRPNASKQVWFDGYTGEVLGSYIWGEVPQGNDVIDWLFPLHTGEAGGLLLKIVLCLSGISLAGLSASGIYLWLARRRRVRPGRRAKRELGNA